MGTRRLMFGWINGAPSHAVSAGVVPYWEGAHSMARLVTAYKDSIVQLPTPEISALRGALVSVGARRIEPASAGNLAEVRGDALEIVAVFNTSAGRVVDPAASEAFSFGLTFRVGIGFGGFNVTLAPGEGAPSVGVGARGAAGWDASILPPKVSGTAELHVFLDKSNMASERCLWFGGSWIGSLERWRPRTIDLFASMDAAQHVGFSVTAICGHQSHLI